LNSVFSLSGLKKDSNQFCRLIIPFQSTEINHSLSGINWKNYFEDEIPGDFIWTLWHKSFWEPYGLVFDCQIEHKLTRTFVICAYMNKAHSMRRIFDDESQPYTKEIHVI
jgi:hypothetical protein